MKKLYITLLALTSSLITLAQDFYSENMGVPTGTTTIAAYTTGTAPATFQNSTPISYSGTATVRTTVPSTGYTGASGGGNLFFNVASGVGHYFQIDGLDTSPYGTTEIQLSFGYSTTNTGTQMLVEQSTNGGSSWTPLTYNPNTSTAWTLATVATGQVASSSTLSLRFTNPSTTTVQMRLDDIKLTFISAACSLTVGTPAVACDGPTLAIDNYTTTIPFTGGGTASYVITPTSGTVSGDNPNTVSSGNIVITGVTEGTNINITISGGSCNYTIPVTAPICKPINTFPYNEPFDYTDGTVLANTQRWTLIGSAGDDIIATTGSLTYPGITSTGNSVSFTGTGNDALTPITSTTDGTLFASFIINVSNLAPLADQDDMYFALFTNGSGSATDARIWFRKNGSQYQYGLGTGATPSVWSSNLYNEGDTQYLVLGYDFVNNRLTLTENPTIGGTSSPSMYLTTSIGTINGFMLRQDSSITTPTLRIDELRIDTTANFTLSATDFNSIPGLNIYPNPANDFLNITTAANGVKNIVIYDVVGKEVANTTTANQTINVSSLNTGIYIVKITEEGKTAARKLVIK